MSRGRHRPKAKTTERLHCNPEVNRELRRREAAIKREVRKFARQLGLTVRLMDYFRSEAPQRREATVELPELEVIGQIKFRCGEPQLYLCQDLHQPSRLEQLRLPERWVNDAKRAASTRERLRELAVSAPQ